MPRRLSLLIIAALASTPATPQRAPSMPLAPGPVQPKQCDAELALSTAFGVRVDVSRDFSMYDARGKNILPADNATPKSVRLTIRASVKPGAAWRLEIRDPKLLPLDALRPADFAAGTTRFWTGRFNVSNVSVELIGARAQDVVTVEAATYYPSSGGDGKLFSTQKAGNPNWKQLGGRGIWDDARAGDPVGMMLASFFKGDGSTLSWCCSGVMITPTLYLTNWHCGGANPKPGGTLWQSDVRDSALMDLGWDGASRNRQYRMVKVEVSDEALDYALVRVIPTRGGGGDAIAVEPAQIADRPPIEGETTRLIHHPVCLPKQISLENCSVGKRIASWRTKKDGSRPLSDILHSCDSEAGSSGGALFDAAGKLLALHHTGVEVDNLCKPTSSYNRAVAIDMILADIKNQANQVFTEVMAAQS